MLNYKAYNSGNDRQWIVMIHGAGGSIEVWFRQISDFARHFDLLLVDLAGHGGSSDVKEARHTLFDFATQADEVMKVVDHLKIRDAHFMGLSLGSIVVRFIADRHPERVCSMVLAGAVTELCWESRMLLRMANIVKHIIPYNFMKWVIAKTLMPQKRYKGSAALFLRSARRLSFDNFMKVFKMVSRLNEQVGSLFKEKLSIPTLYLMGEDDYFFLPQVHEAARQGGEQVRMVIVPEAGHVCNIDNNRFFNQASLEFMKHSARFDA